jgi:hypothetical protein
MTALDLKQQLEQLHADYVKTIADATTAYSQQVANLWAGVVEPPETEFTPVADGQIVTLYGQSWMAQCGTPDGVSISADEQAIFHAASGEHASFDPPRKIRAELGGLTTFEKGVVMLLEGSITIASETSIANSEWCSTAQVHQADTRRADGTPVASSPPFTVEIILSGGKPVLQVRAETGTGIPEPNTWPPYRILGTMPIEFGKAYEFQFEFVDGHGGDGSVYVWFGDTEVVDFTGPTGFEYVDLLKDAYPSNTTGSYWKIGVYAGVGSGDSPPPDTYVEYRFAF